MGHMNMIQNLIDGMNAQMQKARAETQMTLGQLIAALEAMPPGTAVANLTGPHSYRGYYVDLAFELQDGTRLKDHLLLECRQAMGRVFQGYKGGDYVMGERTPIWVANYGTTGLKLLGIHAGGQLETGEDE